MTQARILRIKTRLSTLAIGHGGILARDAIAKAERGIDSQKGALLVTVDAILGELEARFGASSPADAVGDPEGLYALASRLIDISVCLPESLVAEAAHALCSLADLSGELGAWDRQAVEMHVTVLRLLRHGGPAMPLARRRRVVEGLRQVTEKRIGRIGA